MDRLIGLLRLLFGAYPNAKISEDNIAAYTFALKDVPLNELSAVIQAIVREPGDFVPTAGNVLERWRIAKGMPDPRRAALAWNEVLDSMKSYPAKTLGDKVAQAALKHVGGMWEVRHTERPDMVRAQFIKAYENIANLEAQEIRKNGPSLLLEDKEDKEDKYGRG